MCIEIMQIPNEINLIDFTKLSAFIKKVFNLNN